MVTKSNERAERMSMACAITLNTAIAGQGLIQAGAERGLIQAGARNDPFSTDSRGTGGGSRQSAGWLAGR